MEGNSGTPNMVLQSDNNDSAHLITPFSRNDRDGGFDDDPEAYCYICGMELEDHALDFNIDLLFYNNLLQECFMN